jgi:hypothetical protein
MKGVKMDYSEDDDQNVIYTFEVADELDAAEAQEQAEEDGEE